MVFGHFVFAWHSKFSCVKLFLSYRFNWHVPMYRYVSNIMPTNGVIWLLLLFNRHQKNIRRFSIRFFFMDGIRTSLLCLSTHKGNSLCFNWSHKKLVRISTMNGFAIEGFSVLCSFQLLPVKKRLINSTFKIIFHSEIRTFFSYL